MVLRIDSTGHVGRNRVSVADLESFWSRVPRNERSLIVIRWRVDVSCELVGSRTGIWDWAEVRGAASQGEVAATELAARAICKTFGRFDCWSCWFVIGMLKFNR
ncbi:unnamed protein product [Cochlearia groenlandica]